MPVNVVRDARRADKCGERLRIGLINNMPDGALKATERQFLTLLNSAAGDIPVHLSLYAVPGVPRTKSGQCHIDSYYLSVSELWDNDLDGIIMTGAEPCAPDIRQEPYWNALTQVFEWAREHTRSAIWSCLAAHAAVLHLDGIGRYRLSQKRFGVFECVRGENDPLTAGLPSSFQTPHSRWNDVPERPLADCGYRILSRDSNGGADAFLKNGKSLFVFFQGHPEYETDTLLLEYRRDVGSYLRRERSTFPEMPEGYFDDESIDMFRSLREEILSKRSNELPVTLSGGHMEKRIANTWSCHARRVYKNWIEYLCVRDDQLGQTAFAK